MGTAIDFINLDDNLLNTKEGKWLYENSLKYGFSLSYPKGHEIETGYKAEPWHYLYIGPKPCLIQKNILIIYNISFLNSGIITKQILLI